MEQIFDQYFNQILKDNLRYPETFRFQFDTGRITLIPDVSSGLLNLIKSNKDLKYKLLQQIAKVLSDIYPTGTVDFFTDGNNIIIKYEVTFGDIPGKEIGVLANIASNLSLEELDNLCRTNPGFIKSCRQPSFWITLLKERYPQYYREDVKNWEEAYKGLVWYFENSDKRDKYYFSQRAHLNVGFWKLMIYDYYEALKLLIYGDTNKDLQNEILHILKKLTYGRDLVIVEYILKNYIISIKDIKILLLYSRNISPSIIKLYLDYGGVDNQGNQVKLSKEDVKRIYIRYKDYYTMNIETFKLLYEYFDGSYEPQHLLNQLVNMNIRTPELINYIVDRLPEDPEYLDLINWFHSAINNYDWNQMKAVWKKYGKYMRNEVNNLINYAHLEGYTSENLDKLINILIPSKENE